MFLGRLGDRTGMGQAVARCRVQRKQPAGTRVVEGTGTMIERKERKPHWRHTKWQLLATLIPFLAIVIVVPLYAQDLNSNRFLGFPLGYFLATHGFFVISVVTVASYVNRQSAIDHWHGAHEDS
jgi:putative solute:sodium symporter small subunit